MWNKTVRETYALAGLAILTAIVLVACPTATSKSEPPEAVGTIATQTLNAEGSSTIDLTTRFRAGEGESLRYSARSSNTSVATVSVSGATLTITAGSTAGSANITVTATDTEARSASQRFTVTVRAPVITDPVTPDPDPDPDPQPQTDCSFSRANIRLEIHRHLSEKCTLPENHSLIYDEASARVSVHGPAEGNIWTITALKKGTAVVKVNNDENGETAGTITVIVPNTPPRLTRLTPVSFVADAGTFADAPVNLMPDQSGTVLSFDTNQINPGAAFTDVDVDDIGDNGTPDDPADDQGKFRFKIVEKPEGVVIDTDRGFVAVGAATGTLEASDYNSNLNSSILRMRAVILKNPNPDPGGTFDILLNAHDGDNDVSDNPVRMRFSAQDPQKAAYTSAQNVLNGDFAPVRMGNRVGVNHEVTFTTTNATARFEFSVLAVDRDLKATNRHRVEDSHDPNGASALVECTGGAPGNWGQTTAVGTGCYSITSSGVEIQRGSGETELANRKVVFQLPSKATPSRATITIRYNVWVLSGSGETTESDVATSTLPRVLYNTAVETLTLNVHTCVDTADCP